MSLRRFIETVIVSVWEFVVGGVLGDLEGKVDVERLIRDTTGIL